MHALSFLVIKSQEKLDVFNIIKRTRVQMEKILLLVPALCSNSKSILKNIKFPLFIGASLTALYTFIYVIIQLEDYALLVGSIGLFIILAIVMFVSRKIDWHND